jgi:hypothetical protein
VEIHKKYAKPVFSGFAYRIVLINLTIFCQSRKDTGHLSFGFLLMPLLVSFFWKAAAFFLLFRMLFGTLTVTLEAVFLKRANLFLMYKRVLQF